MKLVPMIVQWVIDHFVWIRCFILAGSIILLFRMSVGLVQGRAKPSTFFLGLLGLLGLIFSSFHKPILFWLVERYAYVLLAFSLVAALLVSFVGFRLFRKQFNFATLMLAVLALFLCFFVAHYWRHIADTPSVL